MDEKVEGPEETIHSLKTCPQQCICVVVTTKAKITGGEDVSLNQLISCPSCILGVQPLPLVTILFLSPSGGIITKLQG